MLFSLLFGSVATFVHAQSFSPCVFSSSPPCSFSPRSCLYFRGLSGRVLVATLACSFWSHPSPPPLWLQLCSTQLSTKWPRTLHFALIILCLVISPSPIILEAPRRPVLSHQFLSHADAYWGPDGLSDGLVMRISVSFSLGAFGYFEVTHDITRYSKAKVFEHIGKRTPIAVRFSTVGKLVCLHYWCCLTQPCILSGAFIT